LQVCDVEKHVAEALHARARTSLLVTGPARGLPPRIYVPIVVVIAFAFLALVGYFLRIGLGTTGAALGPQRAVAPQTGGANGVGGGTPAGSAEEGPPAPIQRLLVELRGRVQRNPRDTAALGGLARLYAAAGKYDQALPYFRRALAVAPGDPGLRADYAAARREARASAPHSNP
jgi:cytochrome c-type biogenesis protein CcmH/NrfG